jgi:hypothetical protein
MSLDENNAHSGPPMRRTDRAVLRSIAGLTSILIFEVGGSAVIKDGLGRRPLSNCRLWKGGGEPSRQKLSTRSRLRARCRSDYGFVNNGAGIAV